MASMRPASDEDGTVLVFDVDDPFALPAPEALVSAATNWASLAGTEGRAAFYSAESATPVGTPKAATRPKKKSTPGGGIPSGGGATKPKRMTTAALAENLEGLMTALPGLTSQMATLLERQKTLEDQMATSQTRSILSRPLGGSLDLPQASLPAMTALLDPPPKTQLRRNPGLLETPKVNKPQEILELEAEKAPMESGDALARAVYAQSQALTTLVGQIASAQVDPLGDLSQSSGGTGLKGGHGTSQVAERVSSTPGPLLQVGSPEHVSSDVSHISCGGIESSNVGQGPIGDQISGEVWRLWKAPRAGPHPVPGDVGNGPHDGRQHRRSSGHDRSSSSYARTNGAGRWPDGSCRATMSPRRCAIQCVHKQTAVLDVKSKKLRPSSRSTLDNGGSPVSSRDGPHRLKESRVCRRKSFWQWCKSGRRSSAETQTETQVPTPRKRKRWTDHGRGGDLEIKSNGGQESSPLDASMDFSTWALCLPRWILRCRTPFSWALRISFTADWVKPASPTAVFPLPTPHPMAWRCGGSGLSKKQCQVLARQRLLNVIVVALNYQYFGRACSLDEIGRCPNSWQRSCYDRLRTLIAACGTGSEQFSLAPGRSGPELGAALFQLEQFMEKPEIFGGGYREAYYQKFVDNPDLFPEETYPQLRPYRSLDASRLKLTGTGSWDIQRFIDGELWLPFVEPKFLLHDEFPDPEDVPSFSTESYEENLRLIRLWDSRGLLELFEEPVEEGFYSKVFNAHKSVDADRQIGDRRYPNQRERHVSRPLPLLAARSATMQFWCQAFQATDLWLYNRQEGLLPSGICIFVQGPVKSTPLQWVVDTVGDPYRGGR